MERAEIEILDPAYLKSEIIILMTLKIPYIYPSKQKGI